MNPSEQEFFYSPNSNFKIIEMILPYLNKKSFIDVGTAQGAFTKLMNTHKFVGTLFEPLPQFAGELNTIANNTNNIFFPFAIDYTDRIADFYIAHDHSGNPIEYFSSLHPLKHDKRISHKKICTATCRSLNSLLHEGHFEKQIGFINIDTEGNDLNVMKGMTETETEVLMCEYFMPGIFSGWELGHPKGLIDAAKKLGFENYIVTKRFDEYELISINDSLFTDKQWGNLIFLKEPMFNIIKPLLSEIITKNATQLFFNKFWECTQTLRKLDTSHAMMQKELTNLSQSLQKNIERLETEYQNLYGNYQAINQARLEVISEQKKAIFVYRLRRIDLLIKHFFRPRIGVLYHYEPRPLLMPKRYKKPCDLKKFPTVSIVTPTFNQGHFLERTISSVLEQDYPALEYIIQDGGSTDDTADILLRYQTFLKHWESKKDKGQSNALNLGFRHATGEIMAYLNSDDLLLPGALKYIIHYFNTHPEIDVVYGHRILIDEYDSEVGRWVLPPHDANVITWADYIPQETLFWRKSLWDKIGGHIDENFKFAMDWDLLLRFRDAGAKFKRLPRFLGAFRIHPHQKTSAQIAEIGKKEMALLRTRCHGRMITNYEIKKNIFSYIAKHILFHKLYKIGILRY